MVLKIKFFIILIMYSFILNAKTINDNILTIGFGSCVEQPRNQIIWNTVATHQPDLFIMTGDNAYIDSDDPVVFEKAYKRLSDNPNFANFRKNTPIIGTWDDHDYGTTDVGKEFVGKHVAKAAIIKFFDYPELNETTHTKGGIFHTRWILRPSKSLTDVRCNPKNKS